MAIRRQLRHRSQAPIRDVLHLPLELDLLELLRLTALTGDLRYGFYPDFLYSPM